MNLLRHDALASQSRATAPRAGRGVGLATTILLLLGVATVMRVWQLGNVPGVNGDEAWSGVQALRLLHGQPIDWRTPTGNLINVFYLFPLTLLHAVFPPSVVLLRVVAVASGLAALAANYALCRRAIDLPTAIISTCLLAVQPINIAYSRFGWDSSQSLLACTLVLYLPLLRLRHDDSNDDRISIPAIFALGAAVLVHPTNIFAAPLVFVPPAYAQRRLLLEKLRTVTLPARALTFGLLVIVSVLMANAAYLAVRFGLPRLHGLGELPEFLANLLRFFSGAAVYEYISGIAPVGPFALACNALAFAIVLIAGLGLVRRFQLGLEQVDRCLLLAGGAMLVGFFLVAGPRAIAPHFERYGICLVAPAALLVARGLAWWLDPRQACTRLVASGYLLAAWLSLAGFGYGYFYFIESTGGKSHVAFRTSQVEPKLAALQAVLAERDAIDGESKNSGDTIVTSQWWSYWPLAYFAAGEPGVQVLTTKDFQEKADTTTNRRLWFVEFRGTQEEADALTSATAIQSERNGRETAARREITDFAGRPLLSVVGPVQATTKKSSGN